MNQWKKLILVFALIGAISSTITAFAAGILADQLANLGFIKTDPIPWINENVNDSWTNWLILEYRYFGVSHHVGNSGTWCWGPPPRDGFVPPSYLRMDADFISSTATGFPMRSFAGEYRPGKLPGVSRWDDSQYVPVNMLELSVPESLQQTLRTSEVVLPTRLFWTGFAVNTVAHGAFFFGLVRSPGLIRSRLRSRKGQCSRCGYLLRGIRVPGCPECGWGRE